MPWRRLAVLLLAGALLGAAAAGAASEATPKHYTFSFTVALKPYYTEGFAKVKVTGSGSGSFSIRNRKIDRDGTFYWDAFDAQGSLSLSSGGKVFLRADVAGGTFGTESVGRHLDRSALLDLRITSSTRLHCKGSAKLQIGLQDHPLTTNGDTEGLTLYGCGASVSWNGRPPALVVMVKPT